MIGPAAILVIFSLLSAVNIGTKVVIRFTKVSAFLVAIDSEVVVTGAGVLVVGLVVVVDTTRGAAEVAEVSGVVTVVTAANCGDWVSASTAAAFAVPMHKSATQITFNTRIFVLTATTLREKYFTCEFRIEKIKTRTE